MLASRRGGRVRILRHDSADERSTSLSFIDPSTVRRRHDERPGHRPDRMFACARTCVAIASLRIRLLSHEMFLYVDDVTYKIRHSAIPRTRWLGLGWRLSFSSQ